MANQKVHLTLENRRQVTLCNHNFSREGILHPDRIMEEYDLLFMQNGEWDIIEDDQKYHLIPGSVLLLEPGKHHYSVEKCSPMMRNIYIHFKKEASDVASGTDLPTLGDLFPGNELSVPDRPASLSTESTSLPRSTSSLTGLSQIKNTDSFKKSAFPTSEQEAMNSMNDSGTAAHDLSAEKKQPYLAISKLTQTADHKEIRHTFEKVIDAFWSADASTRQLRCSLHLENLLLQLSELGNSASHGKTDILISEIIHRFHVEPEYFLSPQELADNYNVSVRTISGRFKERTGMSIHQYQLQLKLDMAYDLLPLSPGRSLHDIALSYGFYDEFQFSKLFKRKFGISPSERR